MGKINLLFISPNQFGYLTDYYYYCKYLSEDFKINFLCYDRGLTIMKLRGVYVEYVSFSGNKMIRYWRWLKSVFKILKNSDGEVIFISDFKLCFLFGILFWKKNIKNQ